MDDQYTLRQLERPDDAMWEAIGGGIHDYNIDKAGPSQGGHVCFALTDANGEIAGGLIGEVHWGWFYLNLLFLKEELRGRGYGHQLLELGEQAARQHGATQAYLDTFTFQAPEFYQRHGYRVFGELKDFPPGHTRYYMRKDL